MGDFVLGRLVEAVGELHGSQADGAALAASREWIAGAHLRKLLRPLATEEAELTGRQVVDRDVRVGPYRFLRAELNRGTLEVMARAVFHNYFDEPAIEVRVRPGRLEFRWVKSADMDERMWAFIDGMLKRLTELARIRTTQWEVFGRPGQRVLRGTEA